MTKENDENHFVCDGYRQYVKSITGIDCIGVSVSKKSNGVKINFIFFSELPDMDETPKSKKMMFIDQFYLNFTRINENRIVAAGFFHDGVLCEIDYVGLQ